MAWRRVGTGFRNVFLCQLRTNSVSDSDTEVHISMLLLSISNKLVSNKLILGSAKLESLTIRSVQMPDPPSVSKRIMITLPDALSADLERWADEEGRPTANLAAFLIELAIRSKYPDKYPSVKQKE